MDPLTPRQELILAGRNFDGALAAQSKPHEILDEMAGQHAAFMAEHQKQGHQYWTSRYWKLQRLLGKKMTYKEIVAESWDRQKNDPLDKIGEEMYNSWKQSEGHWDVASSRHTWIGAGMAQGKNGIWYACIIAADRK